MELAVGPLGIVEASITEFLFAEWDGQLRVWCEVDDDLPPVARRLYVVAEGEHVPLIERPQRIRVETMGDTQWVDGQPERVHPTFLVACRNVAPGGSLLFVYGLVEERT